MENGTEKRRKGLAAAVAALVMVVIFGLILYCWLPWGRQWGSEFIWLPFSWWSMPWQSWP